MISLSRTMIMDSFLIFMVINVVCDTTSPTTVSYHSAENQKKSNYSDRLLVSALATVGALLLVALMCFCGYKKLRKNNARGLAVDIGAATVIFHGDLPYTCKDIIERLEALNEEHIIGSGAFATIYKLTMEDGNIFALKRVIKMNEGFDRFFERELEILGSFRSHYLVNLRGYCYSPTLKFLIYDFLSGGSLEQVQRGEIFFLSQLSC